LAPFVGNFALIPPGESSYVEGKFLASAPAIPDHEGKNGMTPVCGISNAVRDNRSLREFLIQRACCCPLKSKHRFLDLTGNDELA